MEVAEETRDDAGSVEVTVDISGVAAQTVSVVFAISEGLVGKDF